MLKTNDPIPQNGTTEDSHLKDEFNEAESRTAEARDEAKRKAHQAYESLQQGTRKIVSESGSYFKKVAADQQHRLVGKVEEYRVALKAASDQLESDDDMVAAGNTRKAAHGLGCVADYLRESGPDDLLSDAGRLARRRPELVFGGLFLAGLGIARVMKSSARARQREEQVSNHQMTSGAAGNEPSSADSKPENLSTSPGAPVTPIYG